VKPAPTPTKRDAAIKGLLERNSIQSLWRYATALQALAWETNHPAFRAAANILEATCKLAAKS
jgi:hypothetical protein